MISEFPSFRNLRFDDKEQIESITSMYPPYSDFTFVSMWSWDTDEKCRVSTLNGNLVLLLNDYVTRKPFLTFVGINNPADTALRLLERALHMNVDTVLKLVPAVTAEAIDSPLLKVEADRSHFDYLYASQLLLELKGKAFETKRNLINRFEKKIPHANAAVLDLADRDTQEKIKQLCQDWHTRKQSKQADAYHEHELSAIERLLQQATVLQLVSLGIFSNGDLIGFSILEMLPRSHAICHFSKTDTSYAGVNDFLMHEQMRLLFNANITTLNYEQDLGIPSLRHSKNSFRPVDFLKKYTISSAIDLSH